MANKALPVNQTLHCHLYVKTILHGFFFKPEIVGKCTESVPYTESPQTMFAMKSLVGLQP